ncbi:MAG TPA: DNA recombination protein RmuC [Candidatus Saccharibacteria bacterium]|nr:DNA recombination protein RmuC [Candidatus Saccharibacteria bacterium]HRN97250.1 DNA recombination protein RmuC [Candidatus Saccharibacteria bacterium]HRQ06602.1 DNA recombination protein RmuC [Candidatus Saccharibacteria bacterium]
MDQTALIVILGVVIVGFAIILFVLNQRMKELKSSSAVELLKSDVTELSRGINDLQKSVGDKLERSSSSMQVSMQKQLSESAKLVADVSSRLAKLDETNRRVVDVADELKTLQNVLQNPKQRGVFGEYYLESVLENILPTKNYQMQYKFKDNETVDAVVFLDKGQILPIDSKFSLENYNRMVSVKDKPDRQKLLDKVRMDLKSRIDETSKYIRPSEGTMDFAFMFIPSESLYYDLLIGDVGTGSSARDLIEYAFRDKKVIIVSPTSFMAYLQTVLQGLRSLQIEEQAKDIQIRVGKLGQHIGKFEEYMKRLGNALGVTVNHYNSAHKELGKVDKDIIKIAGNDSSVEPLLIDRPRDDE